MNLEFYLAERLFSKESEGKTLGKTSKLIATVSVAISVAIIVSAIAISQGFRREIQSKCIGYCGDIWISPIGVSLFNTEYPITVGDNTLNLIRSSKYVNYIQPAAYAQGLLKMPDEVEGIVIKGIDSTYNKPSLQKNIVAGVIPDYSSNETSNDIIISTYLKNSLNLNVGDKVDAYFINDDIKVRRFTISGVYSTGMTENDKLVVYADMRHAIKINDWDSCQVSGYEVVLNDFARDREGVKYEIENILYGLDRSSGSEDLDDILSDTVTVSTVKELFYNLYDWLNLTDLNVLIILVLMIIVSGFNMVSGILILIFEKISQIGLLKAVGMMNRSIVKAFMISAVKIIMVGMFIGNIVAFLFCFIQYKYNIIPLDPENYFVESVPIYFSWGWIVAVNLILLVSIVLILFIPLQFIQRVSPATSLSIT